MNKFILKSLVILLFFSACKKSEVVTYADTNVTAPSAITSVNAGQSGKVTFNVSVDPKLTATYTAAGTNLTVTNGSGSVSGSTLDINFSTTTDGAGSIVLTVTDSRGISSKATAVVQIGKLVTEQLVTTNVTSSTTWTADKVWILGGRITVTSGATLTIEPGTIIKGQAGT
ncbi:MAG TPA: hypothetical protein PLK14_14635, partial [Sediminibacterium sp.]|nr:hypothetical protein [Sediminibacterium sp.]